MIEGPTWLRTVAYVVAPAVRATSPDGEAPDGEAPSGSAPPAQPAGTPGDGTALTRTARRAGRGARRHWLLLILLAAGLGLRVVTQLAYRPAIFYIDSYKYLRGSGGYDPVGYNLLLKPILWAGNLATVAAVQHLLGLAMAVILYLTLTRRHAPRWAAALATAPLLLDAYQLQMEQTIMPDVTFEALILGGLAILLWNPRPRIWRLAAGALVLGLAADVRQIGEVLIIPAVIFAVLVARGWRRRLGHLGAAAATWERPPLFSRSGHAAAGGRVRCHGHRAPLPAAAGPPAGATAPALSGRWPPRQAGPGRAPVTLCRASPHRPAGSRRRWPAGTRTKSRRRTA